MPYQDQILNYLQIEEPIFMGTMESKNMVNSSNFTFVRPFAVKAAKIENPTITPRGSLSLKPTTYITVSEISIIRNTSYTGICVNVIQKEPNPSLPEMPI